MYVIFRPEKLTSKTVPIWINKFYSTLGFFLDPISLSHTVVQHVFGNPISHPEKKDRICHPLKLIVLINLYMSTIGLDS